MHRLVNSLTSYEWLKQLPTSLLQMDEVPLLGFPPPFPLDQLESQLAKTFQIDSLKITISEFQWRSSESLFEGLGDSLLPIQINIPSLDGSVYWVMTEEDVRLLMSQQLTHQFKSLDYIDKDYLDGFYQFIAQEVLVTINNLPYDKTLSPHIQKKAELPSGASLSCDVEISLPEKTFFGRFYLSSEFRKSWKEKYAQRKLDLPLNPTLAEKIQIIVNIEAGRTSLKLSELKGLTPGDFLVLDFCSLEPEENKGRVMLTVNKMPLFRAKIKQGNIKILEHPLYHEAESEMSKHPPQNEDFSEEESELEEFDESEGFEESEEFAEEESFEDLDVSEEESEAGAEENEEESKEVPTAQGERPPFKAEDIPISVIVEVGRLQMSIQKLMDLQPGNVLELDIHPENGVDLVVNGKRIGKGELLRLGESLGVRILDIG